MSMVHDAGCVCTHCMPQRYQTLGPMTSAGGPFTQATTSLSFFIPGPPVTWKRSNGTARRFTDTKDRAYRNHVRACAMRALIGTGFPKHARYAVTITVKQATRADADLSNYTKSIEDALNEVVWNDDSQIDRLVVERLWDGEVGTRVTVEVIAMSKPEPARKVRRARAA